MALQAQDALVRFDQPLFGVWETGAVAVVRVTREWNLASTVSIDYVMEPGTAIPGVDYVPHNGRLTFLPGQGSNGFTVSILDDRSIDEFQTVQLRLMNPSPGAVLGDWYTVPLLIRDDEIPSVLDGAFRANPGPDNDVLAVALQQDGRILIGGQFSRVHDSPRGRLTRLLTDGSLDLSFRPTIDLNGDVYAIAVQNDGRILVGGAFTSVNGSAAVGVARLLANGVIDPSFNSAVNGELRALVIQPDRKILIGGRFTEVGGQARPRIARLNENGSLDTTFDPGPGADDHVRCMSLQPDGKVVVGGQFTHVGGAPRNRVARLNADGALDASFTIGTGASGDVRALALQKDGRILLGGEFTSFNGVVREFLARLQSDGTLDAGFAASVSGRVRSLLVMADQRILIGGQFEEVDEVSRSHVARLHPAGALDYTFGSTGSSVNDEVFALAIQSDDRIVAVGQFGGGEAGPNRLARFFGDVRTNSFALPSPPLGSGAFYRQEDAAGLTLPVFRRGESSAAASVWYRTESLTALAGLDFVGQTNVVEFAAGEVLKSIDIPFLNDGVLEGSERMRVALLPEPGGVALGHPSVAEVMILDNEALFGFSASVLEVDDLEPGSARVLVRRAGEFDAATVDVVTVDIGSATPNVDYTPTSVTLTFAPGENMKEVDVPILPDALVEGVEEFQVVLSNATGANGVGPSSHMLVRIHDEDSVINVLGAGFGLEPYPTVGVTLVRSGLRQQTATVQFQTSSGTATGGLDFVPTNGVVTFEPGEGDKVILLNLFNDGLVEGSETFSVALSSPTGHARVGSSGIGEVMITDNDLGLELAAPQFLVSERSPAVVRLRRNDDGAAPLSVDYALTPITALPGVDYPPQSGTVTLAPGETNGVLKLTLFDNQNAQPDRTFRITLLNPGPGASLGTQITATVQIVDDDRPGSVIPLRSELWPPFHGWWEIPGGASLKVQPEGRILAAFSTYLRLNGDGSPDPGFTTLDLGGDLGALVLGLQPDGKILLGGTTSNNFGQDSCLRRLNASGTRDTSFATPDFVEGSIRAIVPLADGRILVGGDFRFVHEIPGFTGGPTLLRLLPSGGLDTTWHEPSFAGGVQFYLFWSQVRAISVQVDGRILAGGFFQSVDGTPCAGLARFSADGALERTFFSDAAIQDGGVDVLAVQPDGKILIGGTFHSVRGAMRPGLARLLSDGALDPSFSPALSPGSRVKALQLQPDGRILAGGGTLYPDSGDSPSFVVRLESSGALDISFSTVVNGPVAALELLPGGDVMIAGGFRTVNDLPQTDLARLNGGFRARWVVPDGAALFFPLQLIGWPRASYVLEGSANLNQWRALATNASSTGVIDFLARPAPLPAQFYRARLLEP